MLQKHPNRFVKKLKKGFNPLRKLFLSFLFVFLCISLLLLATFLFIAKSFNYYYRGKIYKGVKVDGIDFGYKSKEEVKIYLESKNRPFKKLSIKFINDDWEATTSGEMLQLGFDSNLLASQAFLIGRSNNLLSNFYQKIHAYYNGYDFIPRLNYDEEALDELLNTYGKRIEIKPVEALFKFEKGKVVAFQLSKEGRKLNSEKTKEIFKNKLEEVAKTNYQFKLDENQNPIIEVPFIIESVSPQISLNQANNLGIKEQIGEGISFFRGSITGRIHNITLASSRLNGLLIKPSEIFSFNHALGDISAATGYQSAYIIKDGHTILGDGGGVCQVSTTFFRAALNSGLPIIERHPHSYRVSYYEQGGLGPGFDATVFSPSVDLKVKNDTPSYILIQSNVDNKAFKLTFSFYGSSDNRKVAISKPRVWDVAPPPPDLYQDDPALPKGEMKQVDFAAWGAKSAFDYKVVRGQEVLEEKTFYSNFRPWQAVFLRGTQ